MKIKLFVFSLLLSCMFAIFPAQAAQPVDINTADATAIAENLNGIGPAKAQAIVAYREEHGPFATVDDLALVKGIGLKTIERNRDAITLGATAEKAAAPNAASTTPPNTTAAAPAK